MWIWQEKQSFNRKPQRYWQKLDSAAISLLNVGEILKKGIALYPLRLHGFFLMIFAKGNLLVFECF